MPVLKNPKHERFAQELAKGKTATEAYVLAGYKANDGNAASLKGNQRVAARLAEIMDRASIRVEITRARILEEMAKLAFAPIGDEHVKSSDKRAALMDMAKVEGHVIDRSENGKPGDFSRMNDDELECFIAERARGTGVSDSGARESREPPSPRRSGRLN